jgi:hypothetical protein
VNGICLAQDSFQCWTFDNIVVKVRISKEALHILPTEQQVASEEGYGPWNSLVGILCEPELGTSVAGALVLQNAEKITVVRFLSCP